MLRAVRHRAGLAAGRAGHVVAAGDGVGRHGAGEEHGAAENEQFHGSNLLRIRWQDKHCSPLGAGAVGSALVRRLLAVLAALAVIAASLLLAAPAESAAAAVARRRSPSTRTGSNQFNSRLIWRLYQRQAGGAWKLVS